MDFETLIKNALKAGKSEEEIAGMMSAALNKSIEDMKPKEKTRKEIIKETKTNIDKMASIIINNSGVQISGLRELATDILLYCTLLKEEEFNGMPFSTEAEIAELRSYIERVVRDIKPNFNLEKTTKNVIEKTFCADKKAKEARDTVEKFLRDWGWL